MKSCEYCDDNIRSVENREESQIDLLLTISITNSTVKIIQNTCLLLSYCKMNIQNDPLRVTVLAPINGALD